MEGLPDLGRDTSCGRGEEPGLIVDVFETGRTKGVAGLELFVELLWNWTEPGVSRAEGSIALLTVE